MQSTGIAPILTAVSLRRSLTLVRTWGGRENLLGARVDGIDAPLICEHGNAAQGADCVHQQQRAVGPAQVSQACQVLVYARAAFSLCSAQAGINPACSALSDYIIPSLICRRAVM